MNSHIILVMFKMQDSCTVHFWYFVRDCSAPFRKSTTLQQ